MIAEVVLEGGVERDSVLAEVVTREGNIIIIPEGRQGDRGGLALIGVIDSRRGFEEVALVWFPCCL
jgi:hypothetical protein